MGKSVPQRLRLQIYKDDQIQYEDNDSLCDEDYILRTNTKLIEVGAYGNYTDLDQANTRTKKK